MIQIYAIVIYNSRVRVPNRVTQYDITNRVTSSKTFIFLFFRNSNLMSKKL